MPTPERDIRVIPPWLGRIQSRYLNPVIRPLAPYLPGFAAVEHRGRKSGRTYTTPVNAFRFDGKICIGLGHGRTDWAKNVLAAGEAEVTILGRRHRIVNPRIVAREDAGTALPLGARLVGARIHLFLADFAT